MKKWLLLAGMALTLLPDYAQTIVTGSFVHGGLTRTFRIYVPASYNAGQAVPLVLNLHGYTSNATEQETYGNFKPIADTANFIVVHPNGTIQPGTTSQYWNIGILGSTVDDVAFLEALIDTISAHYTINPKRIYSTGMSNGGYMSYYLACQSNRFAAVGSVTGSMTTTMYSSCNPARPIPTIEIHGTADPVVPYAGNSTTKPIEDVVAFWVTKNNCSTSPATSAVPNTNTTDGATADHYVYSGGTNNHTVEFFKVNGGEHTWPGAPINIGVTCQDFSASKEIWRFFSQYENPTAGINEETKIDFQLWPNPAKDQVYIQLPDKQITKLTLWDIQGRKVYETNGSHITSVDVSQLSGGNYILEISGKDFTARKTLVIQ